MDSIQTLSAILGLGFLTGIRLYATVLAIGLVYRMHWFTPPASLAHLSVLAEPWVMGVAAFGCALEFLADKIPWVDSLWDSFHSIVRPVAAMIIASEAFGTHDPAIRTAMILLCGGVAFAGHSSKAATRLVVNHSPEPFTNIGLSLAEDAMVPFGLWLTLKHPIVTCLLVGTFLAIFCWTAPKIFRMVHVEWVALRSLLGRPAADESASFAFRGPVDERLRTAVETRLRRLPDSYANALGADQGPCYGIFCAGTRSVPGLNNSVGYVCFAENSAAFVTRRMFRYRVYQIPGESVSRGGWESGILFDTLWFPMGNGRIQFDVFSVAKQSAAPRHQPLTQS